MDKGETVSVYLEDSLQRSAQRGEHNFLRLMDDVLSGAGLQVVFRPESNQPKRDEGLSLVHMKPPIGRRGLTFRRVYHYPFWQIERSEKRWLWDVAQTPFEPNPDQMKEARRFHRFWRKRLYGSEDITPSLDGPVYVPLQGRLLEHRSFQQASPLDMLKTTLRLEPDRQIIATMHPKENYSQRERDALALLAERNSRLKIGDGAPNKYLPHCAYVVTQNSAVAFDGFLFDRPAILFAKIDFHHIAQSLTRCTPEEAFARVLKDTPPFAQYVHWFWQTGSINAGRDDAQAKIAARFRALGWPI